MEKCSEHGVLEIKIQNLDERNKECENRISKLEDKQKDVIEMKTLMSIVIEDGKKRDLMFKEQSQTLQSINANLTNLTHTVTNLDNRVINLEDSVSKIDDDSKINWHELIKKLLIMGAVSLVTLVTSFLYQGLK